MVKESFHIQKSIALLLGLTCMVCAMDEPPLPETSGVDAIPGLKEDQNSLFSRMPDDLVPEIGKYKGFKMTCPTSEELRGAAAKNPGKLQYKYKDEKTSLFFDVWANVEGPYKFSRIYVLESADNPSIQCLYTNLEGKGSVDVRLDKNALKAHSVISCHGDPKFRVEENHGLNYMGYGNTDNPEDIVITCIQK